MSDPVRPGGPLKELTVLQLVELAHKAAWAARERSIGHTVVFNLTTVLDCLAEIRERTMEREAGSRA